MIQLRLSNSPLTVMIDDEDFARVQPYTWRIDWVKPKFFYVVTSMQRRTVGLHRFLLGITDSNIHVDHKDHDLLNYQKYNLRPGTPAQNSWNRLSVGGVSPHKGIGRQKGRKTWRARITYYGQRISIGNFHSEIQAALAYDEWAKKLYGEFAYLNFPQGFSINAA